jgi:hypothetical protein
MRARVVFHDEVNDCLYKDAIKKFYDGVELNNNYKEGEK